MPNESQFHGFADESGDALTMLKQPPNCNSLFLNLLAEFDLDQLESDTGTIYGMWPDLTLAYMNPAWSQFAAEHGGAAAISNNWTLGRCVIDAISEPLRPFFIENYGRCLREGRPWEHVYEYRSADFYRDFHMTVFPLGRADGLLVVNSVLVHTESPRASVPPPEDQYRNRDGMIHQCCHCRRIRRADDAVGWDWVSAWARRDPEHTSHGLCAACSGFYYSKARWDSERLVKPFSTINC